MQSTTGWKKRVPRHFPHSARTGWKKRRLKEERESAKVPSKLYKNEAAVVGDIVGFVEDNLDGKLF